MPLFSLAVLSNKTALIFKLFTFSSYDPGIHGPPIRDQPGLVQGYLLRPKIEDLGVNSEALNFRMSNLANVLKEFEKDQLEEEKDHENDDDVTGAVLTENDKSHYQSVEKSNLRPVVVGQKYTGSIFTTEASNLFCY